MISSDEDLRGDAIRSTGVTEVTYYRWRQEFGGLKADQMKRLKELETECMRLCKALADLTLDKLILKNAASVNWRAPCVGGIASSLCNASSPSPSVSFARRSAS